MADIIATVGDISSHLQNPSSIGLNRCVTDQLIHDNINQNETYSISGSYQSKQLVPLSKISFNGGSTRTWTISTHLNSFPSDGLTIQGNIGGVNINKTFNSESDVLTIVINDYQNAFGGNNYLNIKRPSNDTNGGIYISGSFQNIKGFSVDTLENARKFYLCYQERISEAAFRKFTEGKSEGHGGRIRHRRQKNGTFRRELPEKQIYIRLFHVLSGQGEACRENP